MKTLSKKMQAILSKASRITGMTGALYGVETASICGMSPVLWSFLTVVMVGLGLFWMGNLPLCTQVAVLKGDQTHLVREPFTMCH